MSELEQFTHKGLLPLPEQVGYDPGVLNNKYIKAKTIMKLIKEKGKEIVYAPCS